MFKDVQRVLGPNANIVLAGNEEDDGLKIKSFRSRSKSRAQSIIQPGLLNPEASPRYSPSPKAKNSMYGSPKKFDPEMFESSLPKGFLSAFGKLNI